MIDLKLIPGANVEFTESPDPRWDGKHTVAAFPNGYGISAISHQFSYGGREGFWEIAVIHDDHLCYKTPITGDVIGWLTEDEVMEYAHRIAALQPNPLCTHKHKFASL